MDYETKVYSWCCQICEGKKVGRNLEKMEEEKERVNENIQKSKWAMELKYM